MNANRPKKSLLAFNEKYNGHIKKKKRLISYQDLLWAKPKVHKRSRYEIIQRLAMNGQKRKRKEMQFRSNLQKGHFNPALAAKRNKKVLRIICVD